VTSNCFAQRTASRRRPPMSSPRRRGPIRRGSASGRMLDGFLRIAMISGYGSLRPQGRRSRIRLDTPTPRFVNRTLLASSTDGRAHSSAGERSLHTGEVQGSIPCAPTTQSPNLLSFCAAPVWTATFHNRTKRETDATNRGKSVDSVRGVFCIKVRRRPSECLQRLLNASPTLRVAKGTGSSMAQRRAWPRFPTRIGCI
jgi:hypothetical protein